MHVLDLYEENAVETTFQGCLMLANFFFHLRDWFYDGHQPVTECFDTESLARIITVAIDDCLKIMRILNNETSTIACQRLIFHIKHGIFIATGFMMKFFKRNRNIKGVHSSEKDLATHLLKDMTSKIPEVVSRPIGLQKPILHMIVKNHIKADFRWSDPELFVGADICELLVNNIQDLDVTDNKGNTLLITLAKLLHSDYSSDEYGYSQTCSVTKALNFLVSHGAYIYARNNENKTVTDHVANFINENPTNEDAHKFLDFLQSQVPSLQSLAAIKAKELSEIGIVPEKIKQFLNMH